MIKINKTIQDPDLAKVEGELKRAAQTARKIANDMGTPLVIYKAGQIILEIVEEKKTQAANN